MKKETKKILELYDRDMECVEQIMKGMSLDEAEDVGVEILARCLALHSFARKDGVEWFERTTNRIIELMDEWRKDNAFLLACASVANERQKEKTK